MQVQMEETKTEIARLAEEAPKLTDADDIKKNKRATKMAEADYNFAKTRADELYAQYE
jgi:hypothetical protein